MNRDERQDLCIQKWKESEGKGIMLLCTGFGKTITALKICTRMKKLQSNIKILVVVPSTYLKKQWLTEVIRFDLVNNVEVLVVNTAIKRERECDFLILDEVHTFCSPKNITIFKKTKYQFFLGLTATINRLDGKEKLLLDTYPICDTISLDEAIENEWVAGYKQYKLLIDVDLTHYESHHSQFLHHFSFFDYNYTMAMGCVKDPKMRVQYSKLTGQKTRDIMIHAMGFMRAMRARTDFIYNHPDKIKYADMIIKAREDSKIITFTKNISHAKKICCGDIYHAELKEKEKTFVMNSFNETVKGVLNTCKALDLGMDVRGVNTAIIISGDSSEITKRQRMGRAIRFAPDKVAELWTFVLKGTTEEKWFEKSNSNLDYTTVRSDQLQDFLDGKELKDSGNKEKFMFVL